MLPRLLLLTPAVAVTVAAAAGPVPGAPVPTAPTETAVVSSAGILRTGAFNTEPGRVYQFGSVSKTITAAAVESAGLDPDAELATVLPELRDTELGYRTIGDLLHHTSGLPNDITVTDHHRGDTARDVLADVTATSLDEPGTYRYSSLNYLLLQAALEGTDTSFTDVAPGVVTDGSVPAGSAPFFIRRLPLPARHDAAGLGYGYLAGDITTLAIFASRQLAAPSAAWQEETLLLDAPGTEVTAYRHNGAVPGYFSHVTLIPELDRAVVLLTACYGETEAQRLNAWADALVRAELGAQPTPLPEPSRRSRWLLMACLLPVLALALRPRRWGVVASVLIAVASLAVPYVLGYPLHHLWPWAPDIAAALVAWSGLWLLAAVVAGLRGRR